MNVINNQWYADFQNNHKTLCLTFYYNYLFGDGNFKSNFSFPQSNPEKILLNLTKLLNFYIENKLKCNIKIKDDLWLTDLEYRDKIIGIFINKFKNTEYKPKEIIISFNVIHCLGNKKDWFINLINQFNKINIDIKLNIETILIDITNFQYLLDIKDFLLKYSNKLKVKINPNNFVYFTEIFDLLYDNFKPILYLYEEDNVNWTDYKINEYIEFLDYYIDKIYNEYKDNFLQELFLSDQLNLISLKKQLKTCPYTQSLSILLEDFSINPCPKFQYSNEIIDYFFCTDQKTKTKIFTDNLTKKQDKCDFCLLKDFCKGFCHKESYRYSFNKNSIIKESCEMKKAKYAFLFFKLKKLNIMTLENLQQIPNINLSYCNNILNIYNNITQRM